MCTRVPILMMYVVWSLPRHTGVGDVAFPSFLFFVLVNVILVVALLLFFFFLFAGPSRSFARCS